MNTKKALLAAAIALLTLHAAVARQAPKKETLAGTVDEATRKMLPSKTIRSPRVLEKQAKVIAVLDNILKPRPQIIFLMDKTRQKALNACDEIFVWEQIEPGERGDEKKFVNDLKGSLLKFVRKFMDVVLENKSMIKPVLEESLGGPSEHLDPFFDSKPGKIDAFFDSITTAEKLKGIAFEVSTIIGDLMFEKNLAKSVPAYRTWNTERKKKKK